MASCPVCGTEVTQCTACAGSGTVPAAEAGATKPCEQCAGKGFVNASTGLPDSCHE